LGISYWSANLILSSAGSDLMYFFQPGHQFACQRHIREINDPGLASYFALNVHVSQPESEDPALVDFFAVMCDWLLSVFTLLSAEAGPPRPVARPDVSQAAGAMQG